MRVTTHRNRTFHPYDEDETVKVSSRKGQFEPPARQFGHFTDSATSNNPRSVRIDDDDLESRGIKPLDPMADDDSVVLSNKDRYSIEGLRDPAPTESRRKKIEPEAFDDMVDSFQSMLGTVSLAETEAGGCIRCFDTVFLGVDKEEDLRRAQSRESEYSEGTYGRFI